MFPRFLKIVKVLTITFVLLWIGNYIVTPIPNVSLVPLMIDNLLGRAQTLHGREFSKQELESEVSQLPLEFKEKEFYLNKYDSDIQYLSPTKWRVILTPQNRKSYTTPGTWFYRFSTLDFGTTDYPDIEVASANPKR